jgi:hypothetical protein
MSRKAGRPSGQADREIYMHGVDHRIFFYFTYFPCLFLQATVATLVLLLSSSFRPGWGANSVTRLGEILPFGLL